MRYWPSLVVVSNGRFCVARVASVQGALFEYSAIGLACRQPLPKLEVPADDAAGVCHGRDWLEIAYASPQLLGLRHGHETVCMSVSSAEYLETARPADLEDRWVLGGQYLRLPAKDVFGEVGMGAFRVAAKSACHDYWASGRAKDPDREIVGMPKCDESLVDDWFDNWTIRQEVGTPTVIGRLNAWRGNHLDFAVPIEVPAVRPWASLPRGSGQMLERILSVSVAADEEIVLVEWATGDTLAFWSSRLMEMDDPTALQR